MIQQTFQTRYQTLENCYLSRVHTHGYFLIRNFLFADSASVHTPSGESGIRIRNVFNPLSAPEWKFLNIQRNRNRVDANPEKFLIQ